MSELIERLKRGETGHRIERDIRKCLSLVTCEFSRFTTSLDDAKALHEAALPGWRLHICSETYEHWSVCLHQKFGSSEEDEKVWRRGHHWPAGASSSAAAPTPAAAWCAAILRAASSVQCSEKGMGK